MTRRERDLLQPWLDAGLGVAVDTDDEVEQVLFRKRFITEVEGGYALTERGAEHAAKVPTRTPHALEVGRPSMPVDSPEGKRGTGSV